MSDGRRKPACWWQFATAITHWPYPNRYEALAGRAVAAAHLGKQEEALALVAEVLDFTTTAGLAGVVEPVLLLLNCATVLGDAGQAVQARDSLLQADAWVQAIASRISDDVIRAVFLHQRPDNQRLSERLAVGEG